MPERDPAYQRYDWNSLLADEPEHQAIMPDLMDGASYFPSRPEMQQNLETFAARTGITIRYGCRWTGTRREAAADGTEEFVLETTDGEYRAPTVVFAIGVAEPSVPETPGIDLATHYGGTRPAETYADRRVFIIGKQNSGFELASGLLQWARGIVLASPSPAKLSVNTKSLVGVRARYLQPVEDNVLGGGVTILDAAIGRIGRLDGAFEVIVRPTGGGEEIRFEVDEVIAATGFVTPIGDLAGPRRQDVRPEPAAGADAVLGERHRARPVLCRHDHPGLAGPEEARPAVELGRRSRCALQRPSPCPADRGNEVQLGGGAWSDRPSPRTGSSTGRPACSDRRRSCSTSGRTSRGSCRWTPRRGRVTRAWSRWRRSSTRPAAMSAATRWRRRSRPMAPGAIYPVVYRRRGGRMDEVMFDPDPLLRYDTPAVRARLAELVKPYGRPATESA